MSAKNKKLLAVLGASAVVVIVIAAVLLGKGCLLYTSQLRITSLWSRRKIPQFRMANRVRYPMITMRPATNPQRNRRLRIPMANKQKQMLAVWGSPGGGKTVTAVKLALELSKRKKNVVLVFTDVTAPTLPAVVSEKKLPDVSVGCLLYTSRCV